MKREEIFYELEIQPRFSESGEFMENETNALQLFNKIFDYFESKVKSKICFECKYHTAFDGYCKHPDTLSKHVAEYICFSGCGLYEEDSEVE